MEEQTNEKKSKKRDIFGLRSMKVSVRTEIVAGIVTFLAMAYILTLNPSLITGDWTSSTPLWASVFIATALGAFIGTFLMAVVAKMPLAQAPGLGLNSMVGALFGTSMSLGFKCSFGNAMFIVLVSGVIFLLLSLIKIKGVSIRQVIFNGIPESIRKAISVGIGLFIAFIGLVNAGLVTAGSGTLVTLVQFNNFSQPYAAAGAVVLVAGIFFIAVLEHFRVKGSVIIGIIAATLIGIPLGVTKYSGMSWKFWEYFANFFSFQGDAVNTGATFFAVFTEGFKWDANATVMPIIMTIVTFCMIDMFDTMGTCVGCAEAAGLLDENGVPLHYDGIMVADSTATVAGALLGTSTVTTFVESGAGVAAGGKTGLTALVTAICFALSIFLMPLIASIPSAAASCALLYVGALMLKGAKEFKFDSIKDVAATFVTVAVMPLSYSITNGIGLGILTYVIVDIVCFVVDVIKHAVNKENPKPRLFLYIGPVYLETIFARSTTFCFALSLV